MSILINDLSGREVLAGLGAAGLDALTVGTGTSGAEGTGRHNICTKTQAATEAAKRDAESVHRVIDLGSYPTSVAGKFSDRALDELERRPGVEYVEEGIQLQTHGQTLPWGTDRVDADIAWDDHGETGGDNTDGDGGANFSIVDTGIDDEHPDLLENLGKGKAFQGSSWDDDNGHGTHSAGIANAVNNSQGGRRRVHRGYPPCRQSL